MDDEVHLTSGGAELGAQHSGLAPGPAKASGDLCRVQLDTLHKYYKMSESEAEEGQELRWRRRFLGISWCRGGKFILFLMYVLICQWFCCDGNQPEKCGHEP